MIVMVLLGPVALFVGGALWSAFVGQALGLEADRPSEAEAEAKG
ncbi:MAG: hypothetical protein ACRDYF_18880 [Acidimicrobiia bacterium]